ASVATRGCRLVVFALVIACIPEHSFRLPGPVPFVLRTHIVTKSLCAAPAGIGSMRCNARARTDGNGRTITASTPIPGSLTPADLRRAYNIPVSGGKGVTIAVIAANDDPSADEDLAVYRKQFRLPACTAANGCFHKVN